MIGSDLIQLFPIYILYRAVSRGKERHLNCDIIIISYSVYSGNVRHRFHLFTRLS